MRKICPHKWKTGRLGRPNTGLHILNCAELVLLPSMMKWLPWWTEESSGYPFTLTSAGCLTWSLTYLLKLIRQPGQIRLKMDGKVSQVMNSKGHQYLIVKMSVGHEWDSSGSSTWVVALPTLSSAFHLTLHWDRR